ncbi:5-formyltetrahydrofolate cyclo-ligase [Lactonifactor longoviformis]|uniref:5-formyltetrahydrofolate cyclo-ligase n=1 Tax=Lactonifactor longoviformis DSM 17459 TaxID=1122155 RepID=A0A1M4ZJU0_9CLOT|nr:5-formyltetrahydrofolate cyclo-ligase [Lactonifactor longoviformis]POP32681.1 5-formyltetrahydrofolate cyclo-ligase [Lactonifactor longoviformis]SHF18284.1 5-formyltetrahydrofolate cyclo-ligase [Lactonifactor longoviformis DSM 17459]
MEAKKVIRKEIFKKRSEATEEQVLADSHLIMEKLFLLPEFQEASCIYAYADYNHEVSTKELITHAWEMGKKVAVPKVHGKDMIFYQLDSFDQLEPGYFQIPEPARGEAVEWEDALMIVPGVAFDRARHRVGYGQGFYDRYLSRHTKHPTVAVAFDFQLVPEAPYEETDILPDKLVTEKEIIE